MKQIFILFILLNSFINCYGSIFQSFYSVRDGLLSNTVDYITKDSLGIMYISTSEGLMLFTGSDFLLPQFSKEIGTVSFVRSIVQLNSENLLISSTDYGLMLYNKKSQKVKRISNYPLLKEIVGMYKDTRGVVWFASYSGKIWYIDNYRDIIDDVVNLNFVEVDYIFPKIKKIGCISDKIFVCSSNNEFFFLDYSTKNVKIEHIPLPENINEVFCAVPMNDDKVIIGTDNGAVFIVRSEDGSYHCGNDILKGKVVRCIENTDNGVFLGTEGDGLYVYKNSKAEKFIFNNKKGNNPDYIISSYYDDNGCLWLGSWNCGMVCLNMDDGNFKIIYNSEDSYSPLYNWCLESFPNDSVTYVGTHSMGLAYFTPYMGKYKVLDRKYPLIKSLYADSISKCLYVGTFGAGLRVYDIKNRSYKDTYIKEIENERIYVIYPYSDDKLLIGTSGKGLWLYDKIYETSVHVNIPFVYGNLNIRDVKPNVKTGGLWISTYNNGLYHIKLNPDGSYSNFFHIESYENDVLHPISILNDDENTFLAAENGLYKIITDKADYNVKRISRMEGLRLNKIIKLGSEHYIVSSHSGLYFLDRKFEILSVLSKGETISDVRYNVFTKHLEIAGTDNIILLQGNDLYNKSQFANLYLRSVSVNGEILTADGYNNYIKQSIQYADKILLSPNDNNLNIVLSCILYNKLLSTCIYYKMEGLESKWNKMSDSDTSISYNGIPAGEYKLRIRVQSIDNISNERILAIEKSEFWYKTKQAFFLYIIIVLAFVVYLILKIKSKEKIKYFNKVQQIEEETKLEVYNQKLRFITNISHDLKTPLTLVLSPLNDMVGMTDMPDKFKPRLHSMILNGNNLLKKINKIINYKDMELYDGSDVELEDYNLQQLGYEIVMPFKSYAESLGIELEYDFTALQDSMVIINTDKNKFESVMENIISNAIKYTAKGGKVKVSIVSDSSMARITVSDTGRGIQGNDLPHIFDRYYCAKGNDEGTGIGLYLVKKYVDVLGGDISIDSVVNKGTVIVVNFSICVKQSADSTVYQNTGHEANDMKILFVEDNYDLRNFFEEGFVGQYTVFTASSADEAIDIAKQELPDIIVSDYMMPGTDGIELCRILKNDILTSHIPFVILSSLNTEDFRTNCWKGGVDLVEEKPFKTDVLKIKFAALIKNRIILKNKYQYPVTKIDKIKVENELTEYDKIFIDDFNSAIERNIENSDLSIEEIAVSMKMTHDQLYRKVKALTGVSVNQYIRSFRLRKAARMMCENGCSVTEVLYTVGFSNPSYFTKCFKKEFGVLPSDYIEQNS